MRRLLLVFASALLLAAPSAYAGDVASLVTKQDIEASIGKLKEPPKSSVDVRGFHQCDYTNETGAWLKLLQYPSTQWEMQKGIVSEMNPTALSGLGDEAYWVKRGSTVELYVRKGDKVLEVDSTISGGINVSKQVAQKALVNLK